MTDVTQQSATEAQSRLHKSPRAEFVCYFALIFMATLPLSCLTWVLGVARTGSLNRNNPIKSAWSQARIITPRIFQA